MGRRRNGDFEISPELIALFVIIVALAFIINWIRNNPFFAFLIFFVIIGIIFFAFRKVPFVREFFSNRIKLFQNKINTFGPVKDEEIKKLLNVIKQIKIQTVRNEEDFEKQLFQRLDAQGYDVKRQVAYDRRKLDLVVNNKIGIELKVADRAKNVQDLIGQVTVYKKYLNKIVVGVLDVGRISNLDEYLQYIRNIDPENVYVILVKGNVKRYKKKEEYFTVKKTTSLR